MRGTDLHLRPAEAADLGFLRALYASTRSEEMLRTGWQQSAIDAFLTQQFEAQHRHYQEHYPDAEFSWAVPVQEKAGHML